MSKKLVAYFSASGTTAKVAKNLANAAGAELYETDANIAEYETIFIGFPTWWYIAPTIINTFLEAYDFSGRKIVLFATSGGSGFGKAVASLQPSAPKATIIEGEILNGSPSEAKLKAFADKY